MITGDLASILHKEAKSISVGVRPSGNLHLGNITTIALAGVIAQRNNAEVHLTICDIDMPTVKRGEQKRTETYFKYKPVGDTTQAALTASEIYSFTDELSKTLGVPFRTDYLSDIQSTFPYRTGLARILTDTPALREIFDGIRSEGDKRVPVHPVCPCCKHTPRTQAIYVGADRLKMRCRNEECAEFDKWNLINVFDKKYELGVHYFIDPMRDVMLNPKADTHVFGGDYWTPHGANGLAKVEKVRRITEMTGKRAPNYFVGPLLQGPDISKVSKSEGTELSLRNLRAAYDGSMPFAMYVANFAERASGKQVIPYAMVSEFFKIPSKDTSKLQAVNE